LAALWQDAFFQIKEVDIGLAADVGTLQRLPKIVGNDSLVRELSYTARRMMADEALQMGLVSKVCPDKEALLAAALEVAKTIAEKSPIAVQGTKINLIYSRDHSVASGLHYMQTWNAAMLQSDDLMKAAVASMTKEKPLFAKL
jgi:delta(3,5)-delta(2,4)-dienoyl-CoA isomerase